jgi:Type IV secretion system pilin
MKQILLSIIMAAFIVAPAFIPSSVAYAACGAGDTSAQGQVLTGAGESGNDCKGDQRINDIVSLTVSILSFIVGIVAVIMIIVAGFKYITSDGDSNRIGNAKSTLIYAVVGIVIATLAQFIVHFVIKQAR